jgi:hypothetical protein
MTALERPNRTAKFLCTIYGMCGQADTQLIISGN